MPIELILKLFRVIFFFYIVSLSSGLCIYASTFDDIKKEANKFLSKGKILAEIDILLKKRNLETMTPNEYSYLTTRAAIKLQNIGKCQQAYDELKKLDDSYLKKIKNTDRLIRFTDKYRVVFGATLQHLNRSPNLVITPNYRVELSHFGTFS